MSKKRVYWSRRKNFRRWLAKHEACRPARKWVGDKSLMEAWRYCREPGWFDWLTYEISTVVDKGSPPPDFRKKYRKMDNKLDGAWDRTQMGDEIATAKEIIKSISPEEIYDLFALAIPGAPRGKK